MIVAIHQPESFPWLGFFHKMHLSDVFVILDTVQFEKNNVQNRNKILVNGKSSWLTLPVVDHSLDTKIKDIKINWSDKKLSKKHLQTIKQNYLKHPYFDDIFKELSKIYESKTVSLADFNTQIILLFKEKLGIKTKIIRASELPLSGLARGGTEVTLEICKLLGANTYLSGSGAKVYLDVGRYEKERINVHFQEFKHPEYEQKNSDEFISYLSIMDLYFNHGPKSLEIILEKNPKSI